MNVQIAERLAQLRRQNGYSQEELAAKLGLSRQAISKWERAESSPDTDNLIALAQLYDMSLDELLKGASEVPGAAADEQADKAVGAAPATPPVSGPEYDHYHAGDGTARRKRTVLWAVPFPAFVVIIYMILGFGFHLWNPGWILFFTVPVWYWICKMVDNSHDRNDAHQDSM
jgi:transcriptional regulator with XRE-family HTH domain